MADDSIDILEPLDFHPCDSPGGMLYYNLDILTPEQQTELNEFKIDANRDDEIYLAKHPEIRAIVALITRYVFKHRPRRNIPRFIGRFFSRPRGDIEEEIKTYLDEREPHVLEDFSTLNTELLRVPKNILNEILKQTYKQVEINAKDQQVEPKTDTSDLDETSIFSDLISSEELEGDHKIIDYLQALETNFGEMSNMSNLSSSIENLEILPETYVSTKIDLDRSLEVLTEEKITDLEESFEFPTEEKITDLDESFEFPTEEKITDLDESFEFPTEELTIEETEMQTDGLEGN